MIPAAIFCSAVGFMVYVLFGYPLLLGWLASRHSRPPLRAPFEPTVSIIVAVYNGENFIEHKLQSILVLDYPREKMEIWVASDGSTDETVAIASKYAGRGVRVLQLPRAGKPSALNAAMARANGEILVFTDVRQQLAPGSLRLLMENFHDPAVAAASAELAIRDGDSPEEANVGLYWRYEVWIRNRLSAIDSIFGATGAYYAMRRRLAAPIPPGALLDDMHLPLGAFFQGYRLILDGRARMYDYPTGLEAEFRRKVRTLAGNYQILWAYPQLLGPGNRMLWHFLSYKLARLLLPFALIAAAVSTFWLPWPWAAPIASAQALFYAAAAADSIVPAWLRRLTSPARTFVVLMLAALCALSILFIPSSGLWRTVERAPARKAAD